MTGADDTPPEPLAREAEDRRPRLRGRRDAPIRRKARQPLPDFTGMVLPQGETDPNYSEFLPDAVAIVLTPPSRTRRIVGYLVGGIVLAALLYSMFGWLRIFAVATGKFAAERGNQVVEPLEAGVLGSVFVKNGSHVQKDSVVVQLDPTVAQAEKAIIESKLNNARADSIRQRIAASAAQTETIDENPKVSWPSSIPADMRAREETVLHADLAGLVAAITALEAKLRAQQSERDKLAGDVAAQQTLVESRTRQSGIHELLAQQGWDSRAVVLRALEPLRRDQVTLANYQGLLSQAEGQIAVLRAQIVEARQTFVTTNVEASAQSDRDAMSFVEQLKKADLVLANQSIRAPVSGVVQSLAVVNIGQHVNVGEKLMEIVPDDAPLVVQCYVLNADIGFVKIGQPATIKVDTFPFTRYGTISGHVVQVGADAVSGQYALTQQKDDATTPHKGDLVVTKPGQQYGDLVFPVTIAPDKTTITVNGREVPLTAGMTVAVEIETERQRVISYVLYPLTRDFYGGLRR